MPTAHTAVFSWVQSTLMKAISKGQLDGFPPKEVLRTVYVAHDIDASESQVGAGGQKAWSQ